VEKLVAIFMVTCGFMALNKFDFNFNLTLCNCTYIKLRLSSLDVKIRLWRRRRSTYPWPFRSGKRGCKIMIFIMYSRTRLKKIIASVFHKVLHSGPANSIKTSPDSAKSFDAPAVVRGGKAPLGTGCVSQSGDYKSCVYTLQPVVQRGCTTALYN